MNVWIEKTIVDGRADRQDGKYSLGRALWSPQRGAPHKYNPNRQADIYANMREIKSNDTILHFIDNKCVIGISLVDKEHDGTFMGLAGTEWANRPGYLIKLKDYKKLKQPIDRQDLLETEQYKKKLLEIEKNNAVFYTKNLKLRQGAYITKVPKELISILNEIYFSKTGERLPFLETVSKSSSPQSILEPDVIDLLAIKKQIILYGPPGTGKTFNTKKFTVRLIANENV